MTIPTSDLNEPYTLNWKDIHAAKFAYDSPFQIRLADGEILFIEQVIRLIPRRRLVGFAMWRHASGCKIIF